jgi:hypothetical protein
MPVCMPVKRWPDTVFPKDILSVRIGNVLS